MDKFNISSWPKFEQDEVNKAVEILKSGKVNYWTGEEGKIFEREFAEKIGTKYAVALANGSLALSSAYLSVGLGVGDEIITSPRTFIATASSAILLGAKPIFADVDPDSGVITADTIIPLITNNTKAISVVHLGGWPAEMDSICKLAHNYGLKVIEDCAQAHGASLNGKSVGSFGDVSAWSFCQEKILSTGGEGGMITTSNKEIWNKIWSFKDHGKNYNKIFDKNKSDSFQFVHDKLGSNFRMTEIQSAIGRIQLSKLSGWHEKRKKNAHFLQNELSKETLLRVPIPDSQIEHAWYKFYVYLKPEALLSDWDRDRIIFEINNLGFPAYSGSCSEIYLEKCIKEKGFSPKIRLPIAKQLGETSLMFLVHPTITNNQLELYKDAISKIINTAKR